MSRSASAGDDVLRALIVDDEALARARLSTLLGDCRSPGAVVVAQAADAVQAMQHLQHQVFDVILLDIQLPGVDGLALARSMRALAKPPAVVFVSAYSEHAVHAFELEAVDYLTKPVRLERLQLALQKVARLLEASPQPVTAISATSDVLLIQGRTRTERVPLSEVLYFKAELKYVTVRTADQSFILDASLNDLEQKYADRFLRIHRNALVSRNAMRALHRHHDPQEGEGWALLLDGADMPLMVSRRQLATVRELLARN